MNFKNLAMWAVIVILTIGLYNMFKNPQGVSNQKNNIIFSEFLTQVDNGRVVQVEIQGKNIKGIMSNGEIFQTYAPDDPNLIQKLRTWALVFQLIHLKKRCLHCLEYFYHGFHVTFNVWIFFMRQMGMVKVERWVLASPKLR